MKTKSKSGKFFWVIFLAVLQYSCAAKLSESITSETTPTDIDKTTIIVSHRVSSAKNADKIIILDEGKIIEQGTHNQLINQNGYYAALYLKQLSEKELQ